MFQVGDVITRQYHLAIPPGPFNFGYAVDASWWEPDNLPVTDPAVDFPPYANAEDPWWIEYEQLLPISEENVENDIFKVTIHHSRMDKYWWFGIHSWGVWLTSPDTSYPLFGGSAGTIIDDYTTVGYGKLTWEWWYFNGKDGMAVPGDHFGVLAARATPIEQPFRNELEHIIGATFVSLHVDEPSG